MLPALLGFEELQHLFGNTDVPAGGALAHSTRTQVGHKIDERLPITVLGEVYFLKNQERNNELVSGRGMV